MPVFMTKYLLMFVLALWSLLLPAQVTFVITSLPANTPPQDNIFIAGDFNGWNPGDENYKLTVNNNGNWSITLPQSTEGTRINFKFTRGSWATVEKGPNGEEISNRVFIFGNGQTQEVTIHRWADGGSGGGSTASANVSVMDASFFMPQLNRTRRIWIYLPPDYQSSSKSYPVLYMHDGQNLFDDLTSFSGEWQVDETLDLLAAQGKDVPIVVGIDNGGVHRIAEYTPWSNPQYGGGEGDAYINFIVETLKPYIDQNYRTLSNRENTGIMGSSLGGLISHYAAVKHQQIFSKAGVFSPSYWFSDQVWNFTSAHPALFPVRIYQLAGTLEGEGVVENMIRMEDSLKSGGHQATNLTHKIVQGGQHNEALWRNNFKEAFEWLFYSQPSGINSGIEILQLNLHPNPTQGIVILSGYKSHPSDSLVVSNPAGKEVMRIGRNLSEKIDLSELINGTYVITLFTKQGVFSAQVIKQ